MGKETTIVVDEETRVEFLKCLVEGRPFSKRYPVLGGLYFITFRELTLAEASMVSALVNKNKISQPDAMFLASIAKIEFSDKLGDDKEDLVYDSIANFTDMPEILLERLATLSEIVFPTINQFLAAQEVFRGQFLPLLHELYRSAKEDPDFFSKMKLT